MTCQMATESQLVYNMANGKHYTAVYKFSILEVENRFPNSG